MKRQKFLFVFIGLLFLPMITFPLSSIVPDNRANNTDMVKDFEISADGESWLMGWEYRRRISIDGATGAGTNYQITINVTYNYKMQADFDDIRVTDNDGHTLLDHWLENKTDSAEALFWVEVADSLDSTAWVYLYYGNDTVSSVSDGPATFPFFDDFNDDSINTTLWYNWFTDGTSTESGGVLSVAGGASGTETQGGKVKFGPNYAYEFNVSVDAEQDLFSLGCDDRSDDGLIEGSGKDSAEVAYSTTKKWITYDEQDSEETARTEVLTSWQRMSIRRGDIIGIDYLAYYLDDVLKDTDTTYVPLDDMGIWVYTRETGAVVNLDYTFVRKYIHEGPEVAYFYNEEKFDTDWQIVNVAVVFFSVSFDMWGMNTALIILGLVMIPLSTIYLAYGVKHDRSSDRLYFGIVIFLLGCGLFIGGVLP